jgi:Ca2+-binding RTX toxin-like protein
VSLTAGSPLGQQNLPFSISRFYFNPVTSSNDFYSGAFTKNLIKNPNVLSHNWTSMGQYVGTTNSTPQSANNLAIISNDIAPLLHDLGLMLKTHYEGSGSTAFSRRSAFINMGFQQAEIIYTSSIGQNPTTFVPLNQADRNNAINTNLDIGLPVIVEIRLEDPNLPPLSFDKGGHSAIVDGYAYGTTTNSPMMADYDIPYYHVSPGWASYAMLYDPYNPTANLGSWFAEAGAWSYNLVESIGSVSPQIKNIAVAFNLIPSVAAFKRAGNTRSERITNLGNNTVEIVSGRVLLMDFSNNETVAPVPDAIVTVSWEGQLRHTVTTNEKGIYAFVVPSDSTIELNVTSPDNNQYLPIVKEISKTITPYDQGYPGIPGSTVQYSIGNIWGLDFIPNEIIALPSDSENVESMIEDWFDNTQFPDQVKNYGIITKEDLANPDLKIPEVKVLILASDWDYAWTSNTVVNTSYSKILTYVNNGGTLLASGKSDSFVLGMGASKGLAYFVPSAELYNYGTSTSMTHAVQSNITSTIGASSIQMQSDLMRQEQTIVWSFGSPISIRTIAQYVFMYRYQDPIDLYYYWEGHVHTQPTTIDFLYGDGRVMFVNNKITAFHSSGEPGRKYIELLISWLESFYTAMHSTQSQSVKETIKAAAMSDDFLISQSQGAINPQSLLRGVKGSTYYFQAGERRTRVANKEVNKLSFGTWVTPKDMNVLRIDDDLVLTVRGTNDRVTVPGWFAGESNVSEVVFENEAKLNTLEIQKLAVTSEPDIDIAPVIVDARIAGTKKDDKLNGNAGKNEMLIGLEGNDTIVGNSGRKVYYYRPGDGHDTLIISKKAEEDKNALRFDIGITSKDLHVSRSGGDLVIEAKDGSVKVEGWYKDTASRRLDKVEFFTGEIWDTRDIERLASGKELAAREYYIDMGSANFEDLLEEIKFEVQPEDTTENTQTSSGGGCNAGLSVVLILLAIIPFVTNRRTIQK